VPVSVDLGFEINRRVIISMMVFHNANVVTEQDRRRSRLSNAPLDVEHVYRSIE